MLRGLLIATLVATIVAAGPAAAADELTPDPSVPAEPTPTPAPDPQPTPDPEPPSPSPEPGLDSEPEPPSPSPPPEPGTPSPGDEPTPSADPAPSADASPSPAPSASADPAPTPAPGGGLAPWTGRFNLYRSTAWVRQYRDYTCTAASAQTMLNLIRGRSNRSLLLQLRIIKYAQAHDYLRGSMGSDPAGWARALTYFGGGAYRWKTFSSQSSALRYAAARMLATGKPAGLLVWKGRHAWTMTGFTSLTDPRTDPYAAITGVFVAPPLVGVDPKPNTYLRPTALGTFARYAERDGLRSLVGYWVVVAP
jgi:hypothetical protein